MSDLVKSLRDLGKEASPRGALVWSAADRIEALEYDKAVLLAKYDQAKTDRDTAMVKRIQEYADLERQLAEEKALGDRLYDGTDNIADRAAYREARGM